MSDEEDVTAQLLRLAGAPPDPPAERTARVHAAVHREWRTHRQRRTIRNGVTIAMLAAAASVTVAVLIRGADQIGHLQDLTRRRVHRLVRHQHDRRVFACDLNVYMTPCAEKTSVTRAHR